MVLLDLDLKIERFEGGAIAQSVAVSTMSDGTISVSSSGKLPLRTMLHLNRFRKSVQLTALATAQKVVVKHDEQVLASLGTTKSESPRWKIQWWSILRHLFRP